MGIGASAGKDFNAFAFTGSVCPWRGVVSTAGGDISVASHTLATLESDVTIEGDGGSTEGIGSAAPTVSRNTGGAESPETEFACPASRPGAAGDASLVVDCWESVRSAAVGEPPDGAARRPRSPVETTGFMFSAAPDAPDLRGYRPRGRVTFVVADPELAGHRSIDATSIGGGTVSRAQASSGLTRLALRIDP